MSVEFEAIESYIDLKAGLLSQRALVSLCQDHLAENSPPSWVEAIALLGPGEVLDAERTLESHLQELRLLPDSAALRDAIRRRVSSWAQRTANDGEVEMSGYVPAVVRLLHLCPGYEFNDVSIPVEEFPYPPSTVQSAEDLARYIQAHLEELVPQIAV